VQRPNAPSHAGSRLDDAIVRTQARDALVGLGWKPNIARAAVEEAKSHVGREPSLEILIREALRRCPRPG
jgi:Holliday junction resolvasome RuvABC DNA-binding subunit